MKRAIKVIGGILCICCFLLFFAGCRQRPDASGQTDINTNNTESTNIEDVEEHLAQYVQIAIKETLELDTTKLGNGKQTVYVRIPKLLPFSEDAVAAQTEIQNEFDPWVEEIRKNLADGMSSGTHSIDYDVYLNGTVFSLVICAESMIDLSSYRVYNFDIETGKRLNTEELMNKLQIIDYAEKFTQIAKDAFEEQFDHCTDEFLEREHDLIVEQRAKNSSKENIDKAMPYVATNGRVMVILNIYSIAGAEKYPEVFPLYITN